MKFYIAAMAIRSNESHMVRLSQQTKWTVEHFRNVSLQASSLQFGDPARLQITRCGNFIQKRRSGSIGVWFLYEPSEWEIAKVYSFS